MVSKKKESAWLSNTNIPGVEMFQAQLFRHKFDKHFHDSYTIGFNESGQGRCLYQDQVRYLQSGSFTFLNPGDVHTGEVDVAEGWSFKNLYISKTAIETAISSLELQDGKMPLFSSLTINDPVLKRLFYCLLERVANEVPRIEQESYLLEFLLTLFVRHTQLCKQRPKKAVGDKKIVSVVCEYIREHCVEDVSINDLAQVANISPYYLIRSFRHQIGLPPHSYKKQCQVMCAKQALRTQKPIHDIATECGFYDQSHFIRVFKKNLGVTPGRYRKDNFT